MCLVAQSCLTLCHPMNYSPPCFSVHGDSPGKDTGMGCHALFQGIFPTQGSNPGLQHCRWILCRLSHQGSLLPCPPPGDLPNPGIEPVSSTLQVDSLPLSHQGSPPHFGWSVFPSTQVQKQMQLARYDLKLAGRAHIWNQEISPGPFCCC